MQTRQSQQTQGSKPTYGTRISYTIGSAAKLLVYPKDLSLYPEGNKVTNLFLVGSQILIVCTGILLFYWIIDKNYKLAGLLTGMYISILPTFSPLQVSWYIADRYLYLTTALFTIFLGIILTKLSKKTKIKKLSLALLLLILGAYIYKDYNRNQEWQNRKTLWEATARTNPNSSRAYNNLGDVYAVEGNTEKAIQSFEKAIEINPHYAEAMYNLGNLYKNTGKEEKGQELIDEALKINPTMLE
jgi:tetratricopeptide (TPR) repeat protein